jgi:hypothetical protein
MACHVNNPGISVIRRDSVLERLILLSTPGIRDQALQVAQENTHFKSKGEAQTSEQEKQL